MPADKRRRLRGGDAQTRAAAWPVTARTRVVEANLRSKTGQFECAATGIGYSRAGAGAGGDQYLYRAVRVRRDGEGRWVGSMIKLLENVVFRLRLIILI